jgi:tetratricopeptide (TPR) repeat protein
MKKLFSKIPQILGLGLVLLFVLAGCGGRRPTPTAVPTPVISAGSSAAYMKTAGDLLAQKDFAGAISAYERALALDANSSLAYYGRGQAYAALKDFEPAAADFSSAIRLDPTFILSYAARASV